MSQVIKTREVNAYVGYRICQPQKLVETYYNFQFLDDYRDKLSKNQPMGNFIGDAAQEILTYAT